MGSLCRSKKFHDAFCIINCSKGNSYDSYCECYDSRKHENKMKMRENFMLSERILNDTAQNNGFVLRKELHNCFNKTDEIEFLACEIAVFNDTYKLDLLKIECKKFYNNNTLGSEKYIDFVKDIWKNEIFHQPNLSDLSDFTTLSMTTSNITPIQTNFDKNISSLISQETFNINSTNRLRGFEFISIFFFILVILLIIYVFKKIIKKKRQNNEDRVELLELDVIQ